MRRPLMLLAALLAVVALAAAASGQTDPPSSGDWTVQDFTYWNADVQLSGNLTVNNSGFLKLEDMRLTMVPPGDGVLSILVEAGSTLELENVDILSSDSNMHYWFVIEGIATINDTDVRDVAANSKGWDDWDDIKGGVQIYNSSTKVTNSRFHNSLRINMYVSGCSPTIEGCQFYESEYVASDSTYEYNYNWGYAYTWRSDATGLYLTNSNANVTDCQFRDNGIRNTALPFYTTSYSYNLVQTAGRGILAHESAPNITRCNFITNGEQPDDRYIGSVRQEFRDGVGRYDPALTGGLACIGSGANPRVRDSNFISNDVFGLCGYSSGVPALVEDCQFNDNRYLRGSTVYSPSGGVFMSGGGTLVVESCTFSGNLVVGNIYSEGVNIIARNVTNTNNQVSNAYNIYVEKGNHVIQNCSLDGRGGGDGLAANLYVGYDQNRAQVRVLSSRFLGGQVGVLVGSYNGAYIYMANSTVSATSVATFYIEGTTVDAVNCTFSPLRIESSGWSSSTVNIMYFLDILVTWQNDVGVEGAFVQVFNATKEFTYGGITGEGGRIDGIVTPWKTILISSGRQLEFSHSPLQIQAYSSGLSSQLRSFPFSSNLKAHIKIFDTVDPNVYIFSPSDGYAQASVELEVRGMCTDVGAGVRETWLSTDQGSNWTVVGGEEQAWSTLLTLEEGVYDIHVRVFDKANRQHTRVISNVRIDLTVPYLEVIDPVKDTWFTSSANYTIRGKVSGQERLTVNRQVVVVAPDGSWSSLQTIQSGSNEINIVAIDHVGNENHQVKVIVRDSTVPKLILSSPADEIWTNVSEVEVKGITELGAEIRVNGEPVQTFGGRFSLNLFLTEGLNAVRVEAIDKAKNTMTIVRRVHLDTIPPQLVLESPRASGMVSTGTLEIRGTIDDPSVENVVVNGLLMPVVGLAYHKELRLDEGDNRIVVEAWDAARNYASRSFRITRDTLAPVLEVTEPGLHYETDEPTFTLRGRVDEDAILRLVPKPQHPDFDLIYLVRLQDTFKYEGFPLLEGLNLISLEAWDEVGNMDRVELEVYYDLTPPVVALGPLPETTYNELVDVKGILLDGETISINGVPVVLGPSGEFTEPIRLTMGLNQVRVLATDAAGNTNETTVNVTRSERVTPSEGILGANAGASWALLVVMLAIGIAVLYPAMRTKAEDETDLDDRTPPGEGAVEDQVEAGTGGGGEVPEAPAEEPEAETRELPPPPPDQAGERRPPRPPRPGEGPGEGPGEEPVPPWRR